LQVSNLSYGRARLRDVLLIALFLLAISLPGASQLGGFSQATPESEQRPLSKAPSWPPTYEAWRSLAGDIDSYLADRIGFRSWLLIAGHRLRYELGAPVTHDVVMGKRGWLFYGGSEEIEQYLGLRPLGAPQIQALLDRIDRYRREAQAQGALFVFVIAPNKSSIYPEELPDGLNPVGPTPADQLMRALAARPEILAVDGRALLRQNRQLGPLFYKTDSHWNELGAYIVLRATITRAGLGAVRFRPLTDYGIALGSGATDLLRLLDMGRHFEWDVPYLEEKFPAPALSWQRNDPDDSVTDVITRPPPARGRVLVIGDSFSIGWMRFLGENYARAVRVAYAQQAHDAMIASEKPDLVIVEIVERELHSWRPDPAQ
jgi:hypothetical protein